MVTLDQIHEALYELESLDCRKEDLTISFSYLVEREIAKMVY
jgi:hypothetical protein